jgi:hypothetical protein
MSQTPTISSASFGTIFPAKCNHCNVVLGDPDIKNYHIQTAHAFPCNECNKVCTSERGLHQHQSVHQVQFVKTIVIKYNGNVLFHLSEYPYTQQAIGKDKKITSGADKIFRCPCGSHETAIPADLKAHAEQQHCKTKKGKRQRSVRGKFEHASETTDVQPILSNPGNIQSGFHQDSNIHVASTRVDHTPPPSHIEPVPHEASPNRELIGQQSCSQPFLGVQSDHLLQLPNAHHIVSIEQSQSLVDTMDVDHEHDIMVDPVEMNPNDSILADFDLEMNMALRIIFCIRCEVAVLPKNARGHATTHYIVF